MRNNIGLRAKHQHLLHHGLTVHIGSQLRLGPFSVADAKEPTLDLFIRSWVPIQNWDVSNSENWIYVRPRDVAVSPYGWKLHVAARPSTLFLTANLIIPALVREGWVFKVAASPETLRRLNDGITSPATVGKAFTVYPPITDTHRAGLALVEILAGLEGPRILSDRRITDSSPVYYRYGPFRQQWKSDNIGRLNSWIPGPDGSHFDAIATLEYRQPSWVEDPFTSLSPREPQRDLPERTDENLLAQRYRLAEGLTRSSRGGLFRAFDQNGRAVVIKQGRAFVGEDVDGYDVRMRLRNERRILRALDGTRFVPRFVDHFAAAADEFLVMTDVGDINLARDVRLHGLYVWESPAHERSLRQLASQLAQIVMAVHSRGVIVRDISPKNVVLKGKQSNLVDFGTSHFEGLHLLGSTLGYAAPRQLIGMEPRPEDDAYSLGLTLLYAATGLDPAPTDSSSLGPALVQRSLDCLQGNLPDQILDIVDDLTDQHSGRSIKTLHRLADDTTRRRIQRTVRSPEPLNFKRWTANLLNDLLLQADRIATADGPSAQDASYYSGLAGIGWELLQHPDAPGALDLAARLGAMARESAIETELPPGLYVGCTGVELYLRELDSRGLSVGFLPVEQLFGSPNWHPEGHDLFVGSTGIALGHLVLRTYDENPRHLQHVHDLTNAALYSKTTDSPFDLERNIPNSLGLDNNAGLAHGSAGLAVLLTFLADDDRYAAGARDRAAELASHARRLIWSANERSAVPLAASWCRGLAGIARALAEIGERLHDPELTALAFEAAAICRTRVPRLTTVGQCCGLAGIGTLFLHLSALNGGHGFADAPLEVVRQIRARDIGTGESMRFGSTSDHASWASGTAGLLAFMRTARDGTTPELFPRSEGIQQKLGRALHTVSANQETLV